MKYYIFAFFILFSFHASWANPKLALENVKEFKLKARLHSAYTYYNSFLPVTNEQLDHFYRHEFHLISRARMWKSHGLNANKHLAIIRHIQTELSSSVVAKYQSHFYLSRETGPKFGIDRSKDLVSELQKAIEYRYKQHNMEAKHLHTYLADAYLWLSWLYEERGLLDLAFISSVRSLAHYKKADIQYSIRVNPYLFINWSNVLEIAKSRVHNTSLGIIVTNSTILNLPYHKKKRVCQKAFHE